MQNLKLNERTAEHKAIVIGEILLFICLGIAAWLAYKAIESQALVASF